MSIFESTAARKSRLRAERAEKAYEAAAQQQSRLQDAQERLAATAIDLEALTQPGFAEALSRWLDAREEVNALGGL